MNSRKLLMIVMVLVGFSFALAGRSWADGGRYGDRHRPAYNSCDEGRVRDYRPQFGHDNGHHYGWYRRPAPPRYHRPTHVVVKEVHRYTVVERAPRYDEHFHLSASVWEPGFGFKIGVGGSR